jgi:hypothetical protein
MMRKATGRVTTLIPFRMKASLARQIYSHQGISSGSNGCDHVQRHPPNSDAFIPLALISKKTTAIVP